MGIKDIFVSFRYRTLDMGITVQDFNVEEDGTVEISDFEISFDYVVSKEKPYKFDRIAGMIHAMLNDGRHLQQLIFDALSNEQPELINEELREAWQEYWQEVRTDRGLGLTFGDDLI